MQQSSRSPRLSPSAPLAASSSAERKSPRPSPSPTSESATAAEGPHRALHKRRARAEPASSQQTHLSSPTGYASDSEPDEEEQKMEAKIAHRARRSPARHPQRAPSSSGELADDESSQQLFSQPSASGNEDEGVLFESSVQIVEIGGSGGGYSLTSQRLAKVTIAPVVHEPEEADEQAAGPVGFLSDSGDERQPAAASAAAAGVRRTRSQSGRPMKPVAQEEQQQQEHESPPPFSQALEGDDVSEDEAEELKEALRIIAKGRQKLFQAARAAAQPTRGSAAATSKRARKAAAEADEAAEEDVEGEALYEDAAHATVQIEEADEEDEEQIPWTQVEKAAAAEKRAHRPHSQTRRSSKKQTTATTRRSQQRQQQSQSQEEESEDDEQMDAAEAKQAEADDQQEAETGGGGGLAADGAAEGEGEFVEETVEVSSIFAHRKLADDSFEYACHWAPAPSASQKQLPDEEELEPLEDTWESGASLRRTKVLENYLRQLAEAGTPLVQHTTVSSRRTRSLSPLKQTTTPAPAPAAAAKASPATTPAKAAAAAVTSASKRKQTAAAAPVSASSATAPRGRGHLRTRSSSQPLAAEQSRAVDEAEEEKEQQEEEADEEQGEAQEGQEEGDEEMGGQADVLEATEEQDQDEEEQEEEQRVAVVQEVEMEQEEEQEEEEQDPSAAYSAQRLSHHRRSSSFNVFMIPASSSPTILKARKDGTLERVTVAAETAQPQMIASVHGEHSSTLTSSARKVKKENKAIVSLSATPLSSRTTMAGAPPAGRYGSISHLSSASPAPRTPVRKTTGAKRSIHETGTSTPLHQAPRSAPAAASIAAAQQPTPKRAKITTAATKAAPVRSSSSSAAAASSAGATPARTPAKKQTAVAAGARAPPPSAAAAKAAAALTDPGTFSIGGLGTSPYAPRTQHRQ